MGVLIVSSTIAIVVSFLCSLAESILLSLNPLTISKMKAHKPAAAHSWTRMKTNISRPIAAILILNTVAHTAGATVAGSSFSRQFGEGAIWIFSTLFTTVILLGTEILPKIIGVSFLDRLAPLIVGPLETITWLLKPVIRLIETMFRRLTHNAQADQITTSDVITLASLARAGKAIGLEQENIIINAIRLNHTPVSSVMIPSDRVKFISHEDELEKIIEKAEFYKHTRYPISTTGQCSDIQEYISIKEVIALSKKGDKTAPIPKKPLIRIQSNETLLAAMKRMLESRQHMVSVFDNKCFAGIITLEDITSELLGASMEDMA